MNIVPRDPWFNMDNFFDDLFTHRHLIDTEGSFKPRVDIIDKDNEYVFVAELPGVAKEDINVNVQDGVLTIEAKVNKEETSETDRMIRKERRSGFFSRSINVGKSINADDIKAEFINGLLKLTAPKPKETTKEVHKIDIS
ncbi:MAG: Hsp20/alpha crystallin family protein [Psychromonas sp.]|nr:Hsp20/alpha crystallin family protein [Psychromonas sp.]